MNQDGFVRGYLDKVAASTHAGVKAANLHSEAYLRLLQHANLTPAQKKQLHTTLIQHAQSRGDAFKQIMGDHVSTGILGDSPNYIEGVIDDFLGKNPKANVEYTGNSYGIRGNTKANVNAQVINSHDTTAFQNAMLNLLKQQQKEYSHRSWLSRLVHRKPTEKDLYSSSKYENQRKELYDENPATSTYYATVLPQTNIPALKKLLGVKPNEKIYVGK